jgi:ACS family tartrate transporter-like MFS transporter
MSGSEIAPKPMSSPIFEAAVLRKATLRLVPFLFLLYVINLSDRTNIGMAKRQMVYQQKVIDENAFSWGPGAFYIGYLIFEVPSNLILVRVGARVWIARILMSWGLISACMMFVTGPWSFYILRVLLGIAEAGFFPGVIFYLSQWFPARARARVVASFMTGGVIASMVGNPLSGVILDYMNGIAGLWGWQWVFLLEGVPAVALGFVTLRWLTDRPDQAHWLTPAERAWLTEQMQLEARQSDHRLGQGLAAAFASPRVWLLIAVYFTVAFGENSFGFYVPTFLNSRFPDWSDSQIGFLVIVPNVAAIIGMNLIGRHSDRTGERRWHVAGSAFLAASGWILVAAAPSGWLFVLGLAAALTGMKSMLPTFWTIPPSFLTGIAAASGLALINSVANLGGLFGPRMIREVKAATGSYTNGYLILAATLIVGGILVLTVRMKRPSIKE